MYSFIIFWLSSINRPVYLSVYRKLHYDSLYRALYVQTFSILAVRSHLGAMKRWHNHIRNHEQALMNHELSVPKLLHWLAYDLFHRKQRSFFVFPNVYLCVCVCMVGLYAYTLQWVCKNIASGLSSTGLNVFCFSTKTANEKIDWRHALSVTWVGI